MIYLDACALVKFVKPEKETGELRSWRAALPPDVELVSSALSRVEITRAVRRAGVDTERVPYVTEQALRGVYLLDVTSTVLARAAAFRTARLGTVDAIHLASAEPLRADTTHLVTYDTELAVAASDLGFAVTAPGSCGHFRSGRSIVGHPAHASRGTNVYHQASGGPSSTSTYRPVSSSTSTGGG